MNPKIKHGLSFVALATFALFAMGTSKAKEDTAGGSSGSGGALAKLAGSCDLVDKLGLCVEFDSSLTGSLGCGVMAALTDDKSERWKKNTGCPRNDKLLGTCLAAGKDNKEMTYYYHPTKT